MASLSIANFVPITGTHDISAQGFTDWALWNSATSPATSKAPSVRKSGGGSLIGNLTCSVAQLESFTAALHALSWTGGTPTASGSTTNGEYNNLNGGGTTTNGADCSWTFPVGTAGVTARVYLGAFASNVTITATLSDASAGPASNTSMVNGSSDGADSSFGYLDITAAAGSNGQTLTVTATAAAAGFSQFSDVEPGGAGLTVNAGGSTITAATGTATTSTMQGAARVARAPTAAAGTATASTLTGRSTAAGSLTAAAGSATSGTLTGRAIVAASITPAAGAATSSTLAGRATSRAAASPAAGTGTTSTIAGRSTAAASITPAAGSATAATLVGSSTAPGAANITPAAGQATTATLQGSSIVAANMVPAQGSATTATLGSNGIPQGLPGIDYESGGQQRARAGTRGRQRAARDTQQMLRAAMARRFPMPEPTYSQMRVDAASSARITAWARKQGFASVDGDLHVTLAYSREPVDLRGVPLLRGFEVPAGGRSMDQFGDAVVLKITSERLTEQWEALCAAGASWDFDSYEPHITITYERGGVDLAGVQPYRGPIVLLDEEREALDEDYDPAESLPEPAADAVSAGLVALEAGTLTPERIERLASTFKAEVLPVATRNYDAELAYLQTVLRAREQAERRRKDDEETALALLL